MEVHCNEDFFGFPAGVPIDLSTLECVSYGVTPGVGGPLAGNPFCDLGYPALPGQYSVHNADVNAHIHVTYLPEVPSSELRLNAERPPRTPMGAATDGLGSGVRPGCSVASGHNQAGGPGWITGRVGW